MQHPEEKTAAPLNDESETGAEILASEVETEAVSEAQLREQLELYYDKWKRQLADQENDRRRYERMIEDAKNYAIKSFANDLLQVVDSFERGLEVMPNSSQDPAVATMAEGIRMTDRILRQVLERFGVHPIAPEPGEGFDSQWHQAVAQVPTNEIPAGAVVAMLQKGFRLQDRVLRPAMVSVAKPAPATSNEGQ
jgi:molecular chaperone GrpE